MDKMLRLIIVEDSLPARRALKAVISLQTGFSVIAEASNGQEAIHCVSEHIPDIVLMDMRMPVMDGMDATHVIKERWPQIKIVILTMYSDSRPDAVTAGADAFLVKGCPIEEMASTLRALN
jgi:YesN/AraC family two-component response regulator